MTITEFKQLFAQCDERYFTRGFAQDVFFRITHDELSAELSQYLFDLVFCQRQSKRIEYSSSFVIYKLKR